MRPFHAYRITTHPSPLERWSVGAFFRTLVSLGKARRKFRGGGSVFLRPGGVCMGTARPSSRAGRALHTAPRLSSRAGRALRTAPRPSSGVGRVLHTAPRPSLGVGRALHTAPRLSSGAGRALRTPLRPSSRAEAHSLTVKSPPFSGVRAFRSAPSHSHLIDSINQTQTRHTSHGLQSHTTLPE